MRFITCGVTWGDYGFDFSKISMKNHIAILGVENKNIGIFRHINSNDDYIALKKGFNILALGKVKQLFSGKTWGDIQEFILAKGYVLNPDELAAITKLAKTEVDFIEVDSWITLEPPIEYQLRQSTVKIGAQSIIEQSSEIIKNYLEDLKMVLLQELLEAKKQIILQGAPGTGKTYTTAELAVRMIDGDKTPSERKALMERYRNLAETDKRIFFTTFHPSLDYEEFIEGYKPNGKEGFELNDGIFKKACTAAMNAGTNTIGLDEAIEKFKLKLQEKEIIDFQTLAEKAPFKIKYFSDNDNRFVVETQNKREILYNYSELRSEYANFNKKVKNYVSYHRALIDYFIKNYHLTPPTEAINHSPVILIIDEINRGHISKIFGELITLLEADKRRGEDNALPLTLPYSGESFTVPPNLYIIGTMNTSDRTIGYIDYALRRRFAFVTIPADETKVSPDAKVLFEKVSSIVKENLSPEFEFDDLMIGHSYFMAGDKEQLKMKLEMKLEYEIRPLLLEYLKDGILIGGEDLKNKIKGLSL